MENNVSLDLMEFIEQQILPRYAAFDKAHSMEHVTGVIRRSLTIARRAGADIDMAYAIAAYHDLGLEGPRAIHHLTSGKILMADARLKRWFSTEQMKIMKEAVEDHPAILRAISTVRLWPRPTATWSRQACSGVPSSSDFHIIPRRLLRSTGSDLWLTWTKSIPPMATYAYGWPTHPTKKN